MNQLHSTSKNPAFRCFQAGLTLVELLIALTLGLLLLTALTALIARQSYSRAELDKSGKQIENGRYALSLLQDDIQHAGFYGQYGGALTTLGALPDPCTTVVATIDSSLAMPIQGYDSPSSVVSPLSGCLANANHVAGTDILVIRRTEVRDVLATIGTAVNGQVYIQATPDNKVTGVTASPSPFNLLMKDGVTPAPLRRFVEYIYFISPCNVYASGQTACNAQADRGTPIPTLKRLELSTDGTNTVFITTPLVEGIENMQLDYGIDVDGKGAPSSPFITAPSVAQWPNVVSIQVSLLARNTVSTGDYVDSKTYSMGVGGSVGPFSDNFKRHLYTALVRVTNPSSRRE